MIRSQIKDRGYRVFTYQDVDRVPDIEFGYWPQTIRRWLSEGMQLDLTIDETTDMFSPKVDQHFGFENEGFGISGKYDMHPIFPEEILEKKAESVIFRDSNGIIAERYLHDSDNSSIPHFLEFPIKTPSDWESMKQRYQFDDPSRSYTTQEVSDIRNAISENKEITIFFVGFYGKIRDWMGVEALSYAFFDYPEMIQDMVNHWSELCVSQINKLPPDIVIDRVNWWEDMAFRNGPLVGPKQFRKLLQPGYHRVMTAAKKRGCILGMVDCDGNPHDLVQNWLDEGVNIMFPLEIGAGVDPFAWRKEFGKDLRLRGGIAKAPLVLGGKAIDKELERIRPLLEQGGYIPHLDHLVPPDISYSNYCEYLDKKRKLIGK
jgi:hypothetical protein